MLMKGLALIATGIALLLLSPSRHTSRSHPSRQLGLTRVLYSALCIILLSIGGVLTITSLR